MLLLFCPPVIAVMAASCHWFIGIPITHSAYWGAYINIFRWAVFRSKVTGFVPFLCAVGDFGERATVFYSLNPWSDLSVIELGICVNPATCSLSILEITLSRKELFSDQMWDSLLKALYLPGPCGPFGRRPFSHRNSARDREPRWRSRQSPILPVFPPLPKMQILLRVKHC